MAGLENAVYQREAHYRPALPSLRQNYARRVVEVNQKEPAGDTVFMLEDAHFRRVLGKAPSLPAHYREMLAALEFSGEPDAPVRVEHALAFLRDYFYFVPGKAQAEEVASSGGTSMKPEQRRISDRSPAQTRETLRQYMRDYFSTPLYDDRQLAAFEESFCVDDHAGCHLCCAAGDDHPDPDIRGYAGAQRWAALRQMEKNRAAYEADATRPRTNILRLTARIRNAMLVYTPVRWTRLAGSVFG